MTVEELPHSSPSAPPALLNIAGKLVVKYLEANKRGASASQILKHLRLRTKGEPIESELDEAVLNVLENGTALGFLERSGSQFVNYRVRNMCKKRGRCKGPKRTIRRRIRSGRCRRRRASSRRYRHRSRS